MVRSTTEVEIKLRFDSAVDAVSRLLELGARPLVERTFEDNVLFEQSIAPLKPEGKMLRLRQFAGEATLTFKQPVPGQHRHKVREEHETRVGDSAALVSILEGLGFSRAYRYQKYRTIYQLDEVHACVDETPLGCFIELEGEPQAIDRAAERLGFRFEQYIRGTYRDLHEQATGRQGEQLGDLLL